MPVPVFVCVPCQTSVISLFDGFPIDKEWTQQPVGVLSGFEFVENEDAEKVARDLGRPVKYLVRVAKADNGCVGNLIALAVECGTYEEAASLPGFSEIGCWAGAYYGGPLDVKLDCPMDAIQRLSVSAYRWRTVTGEFVSPPYRDDGSFSMSLVNIGTIARYVFFRDDPLHFYVCRSLSGEDAALHRVREFRAGTD